MPEFAEVEFYRKRWALAAPHAQIIHVAVHERAKIYRGTSAAAIAERLTGATLSDSATAAKQMLFHFTAPGSRAAARSAPQARAMGASQATPTRGAAPHRGPGSPSLWLGVHLGMSGDMTVRDPDYQPGKHDHLVLYTAKHALVLEDPRMFGRVQFAAGAEPPAWWTSIAPAILSKEFTVKAVAAFLKRRARAPIKAVLLMQERFPGIGNWMADEVLWRAAIHPRRKAGSLQPAEVTRLWKECRQVCRQALTAIAGKGRDLPPSLNHRVPRSWLMPHRWQPGGRCPKTGVALAQATIGGRTTVWSPARQKLPRHA